MEEKKYGFTFPHVKGTLSTSNVMRMVLLSLAPAAIFGVIYFGPRALFHLLVCVAACVLTEFTFEAFLDRPLAVTDCSAAVTGMLLAMLLPVGVPVWMGVIGGVFAIAVIKMAFGGIGRNRLNPALGGYCLLMILFSEQMRDFSYGTHEGATLLGQLLSGETVDPFPMLWGNTAGALGTTSSAAILAGAVILLAFGIIKLRIPAAVCLSFVLVLGLFGGQGFDQLYLTTQLLGGGFLLGAWFLASDYVTSPITKGGQILYGLFIGTAAAVLRLLGIEEAIVYAVLLGNLAVPFLEKLTIPKAFGQRKMTRLHKE